MEFKCLRASSSEVTDAYYGETAQTAVSQAP